MRTKIVQAVVATENKEWKPYVNKNYELFKMLHIELPDGRRASKYYPIDVSVPQIDTTLEYDIELEKNWEYRNILSMTQILVSSDLKKLAELKIEPDKVYAGVSVIMELERVWQKVMWSWIPELLTDWLEYWIWVRNINDLSLLQASNMIRFMSLHNSDEIAKYINYLSPKQVSA